MIPSIVAICLIPVYLLVLLVTALGALSQLGRAAAAYRRRRTRRRRVRLLSDCARSMLVNEKKLEGCAELSRWVTANMLLASHRERREGVRANA